MNIIIDWTKKDAYFGFFMVWTNEDHCLTEEDEELMDCGPTYPKYYEKIEKVNYLKMRTITDSQRAPSVKLTQVDMDDEDYDDIVRGKLSVDKVGFDLEYQNWEEPPIDAKKDDDGELEPGQGTGMIIEIDGDDWLRKYSRGNNA